MLSLKIKVVHELKLVEFLKKFNTVCQDRIIQVVTQSNPIKAMNPAPAQPIKCGLSWPDRTG